MLSSVTYLIVDIGSGTVRVSLYQMGTGVIAQLKENTPFGERMDLQRLWIKLKFLIKKIINDNHHVQVGAICVSSLLGWVAVDIDGCPVDDSWTWAHRETADFRKYATLLDANVGVRIGRRMNAELAVLKLLNLRDINPKKYASVACFCSIKDFVNFKLTGKLITDPTHAAYTGIFSVIDREWDKSSAARFGIDLEKFPPCMPADTVIGGLSTQLIKEFGCGGSVPVINSGPDGTLAVLGGGGICSGKTVNVMGTTDVIFTVSDMPIVDETHSCVTNPHVLNDLWLIGGPMGMTGGAVRWFVEDFIETNYETLEFEAAGVVPGSDGLLVIPSLTGERAPTWISEMRGTVVGLSPAHSKAHFHRALLEGNAYAVKSLLVALERSGCQVAEIVCIGGGVQSELSLQIRADVLDKALCVPSMSEATTVGAVILCAITTQVYDSLSQVYSHVTASEVTRVRPDQSVKVVYGSLFEKYRTMSRIIGDFYSEDRKGR